MTALRVKKISKCENVKIEVAELLCTLIKSINFIYPNGYYSINLSHRMNFHISIFPHFPSPSYRYKGLRWK
jgi:hypothetical protein